MKSSTVSDLREYFLHPKIKEEKSHILNLHVIVKLDETIDRYHSQWV